MGAHPSEFDQRQIARKANGLGDAGNGWQAEPGAGGAFVGAAVAVQPGIARTEHDQQIVARGIGQRLAQRTAVRDRVGSGTHGHTAGFLQRGELGELFASQRAGERSDGMEARASFPSCLFEQAFGHCRRVDTGTDFRRNAQAGNAAGRCGAQLLTKVAERSGAQVDQAGQNPLTLNVEALFGHEAFRRRSPCQHAAVQQMEILVGIHAIGGIDDAAAGDGQRVHAVIARAGARPSTSAMTAIRTAIPLVTCSRITDCGPSATAEAISTLRLMGPGCMTMASGRASLSRAVSTP